MLTPIGLVLALVMSAPALWDVVNGSMGLTAALLRLLGALIVAAIGTSIMRRVMAPQPPRPDGGREQAAVPVGPDDRTPRRRETD